MQAQAVIGERMEALTLTADNLDITCNGEWNGKSVSFMITADRIARMTEASPGQHDICCKG